MWKRGVFAVKKKSLVRSIEEMPRSAYIFLRGVLALSCAILFVSWLLFLRWEQGGGTDHSLYMTAVTLLETPAALLLLGGVGTAFLIDRSPAPPK